MLNLGQLNTIKAYIDNGQFEALDEYLSQVYGKQIVGQLGPPVILQNAAPCNDHGLVFEGIRKDGKFYTLDGQKEIFDPYYKKYSAIALLTEEEQRFLLTDYLKMRTIINQCASILSK